MPLDNLEYISINNQRAGFPKHFHETFCISLIHQGTEQIDFENQRLFSESGSISITNPYEVHSNPLIDSHSHLKFDTIYISNDLMKYLFDGKNIFFSNRKINSQKASQKFAQLTKAMDTENPESIEFFLHQFVNTLQPYSQEDEKEPSGLNFDDFHQVNSHIENHIYDKFCLNELSKMANINKFGFIKKFRASTGMTPMNYILMKKIFSCKNRITPNAALTEIAYQYNFTDMAHFSKTFKRYIGLSPKMYKESLVKKP